MSTYRNNIEKKPFRFSDNLYIFFLLQKTLLGLLKSKKKKNSQPEDYNFHILIKSYTGLQHDETSSKNSWSGSSTNGADPWEVRGPFDILSYVHIYAKQ